MAWCQVHSVADFTIEWFAVARGKRTWARPETVQEMGDGILSHQNDNQLGTGSGVWHPALPSFSAVVFDFDGTLAPCLDLADLKRQSIALAVSAGVDASALASRYILEGIAYATAEISRQDAGAAQAYAAAAAQLLVDVEVAAARETTPFPWAGELVARLRAAGKGVAVVTRNCTPAIECAWPGIGHDFDIVLTRDHVQHVKPDVRHTQAALTAMQVAAGETLMVGDTGIDIETGRRLGLFAVGVSSGVGSVGALLDAGADLVLSSAALMIGNGLVGARG